MIRVLGQLSVFVLALLVFAPTAAQAQAAGPLRFVTGGGFAVPTGNHYSLRTGYQIHAAVETNYPGLPFALRVEGLFARFGYEHSSVVLDDGFPVYPVLGALPNCDLSLVKCPGRGSEHERIIAGTLNVVMQPPQEEWPGLAVVPYLIAGGGVYHHKNNAQVSSTIPSGTDFGLNGGGGLRIPKFHVFAEGRMHMVKGAPDLIAVTFGLAW